MLEARIEEFRLERAGAGDTSYILRIQARTRLVRAVDGVVLYDQTSEYRSGPELFVDWTLHDAFESVADTGYRALADHIVQQILVATEKPLQVRADHKRLPTPSRNAAINLAASKSRVNHGPTLLASYPIANSGTFGIY